MAHLSSTPQQLPQYPHAWAQQQQYQPPAYQPAHSEFWDADGQKIQHPQPMPYDTQWYQSLSTAPASSYLRPVSERRNAYAAFLKP